MPLESPAPVRLTLAQAWRDLGPASFANGMIGFIFAATGPIAVVLAAAGRGNLTPDEIASWIFACFVVNGLITLIMTWTYRQPLSFFWTIPGTVLAGQALTHLNFAEVVGAFYTTSLLILALGLTGLARRALDWVPMPIVMGMVAGVFLRFGLDLVRALHGDPMLAWAMLATFLGLSVSPRIARMTPPILGALIVGVALCFATARIDAQSLGALTVAKPLIASATFSWPALVELVAPLATTVLVVQNGQGYAVLQAAGHHPPANAVTVACGVGGVLSAAVGASGTCLAGPTNAIIVSSGEKNRHYSGALVTGTLALLFGLFSPTFTRLMLATPKEFIMMLGGLAMLRVLQGAFVSSFRDKFSLGALASFLVTVADLPILGVGAAFWGLVAGVVVSRVLEREQFGG